jgi:hypothetical protein
MSLAIDVESVAAVLLPNGWHTVENHSFELGSYEYVSDAGDGEAELLHGGGTAGVCATGFSFDVSPRPGSDRISGPLTAILAVRHRAE